MKLWILAAILTHATIIVWQKNEEIPNVTFYRLTCKLLIINV